MVLSSWHNHCESSPGLFVECRLSAGWPPTLRPCQPIWAVSPPKDWLLPSADTIAIYYYYSTRKLILSGVLASLVFDINTCINWGVSPYFYTFVNNTVAQSIVYLGCLSVCPSVRCQSSVVRLHLFCVTWYQRHHHKPDCPRKCPWQDHETTSCDVWSRKTTSRSHSGPHGTASGCQGKNWSLPRQQAAVETSTWPASPSVDATTGSQHRTRRWCRMGHSQWSSSMEGTTTHRRSSGLMNEWMNDISVLSGGILMHLCNWAKYSSRERVLLKMF